MDRPKDTIQNTQSDDQQMVTGGEQILENSASPDLSIREVPELETKPIKKSLLRKLLPMNKTKLIEKNAESLEDSSKAKKKWFKSPWFIGSAILSIIILAIGSWLGIVGYNTYNKLKVVSLNASAVSAAIENRDLALAKEELSKTNKSLEEASKVYSGIAPLKVVPILGNYIKDGSHVFSAGFEGIKVGELAIEALVPYADVLGFTGSEQKLEFASAEERIIFLATTVEKLSPQMDEIGAGLQKVSAELDQIDEKRYPKEVSGKEIRSRITSVKDTVRNAGDSIAQFQPFIELLPDLLGNPEPRRYLLLFQNDAELRPTGGFLTAYATLNILRGKITPGVSEDIYTLDNSFNSKIPAPDPIKKYLPLVYVWNLRDMNLSPDFKVSMDTFTNYYQKTPIAPEVDAVIAVDTDFMVKILKVLGPIGVPGYGGQFSAENDPKCDCPQVIYALENIITRPTYEIREGRKSILGPLMNSMLANMMGSPKAKWAEFFTIFTQSIQEKHVLMYFFDEGKQAAVEALGAAGRINTYEGDYLHINDTNFAGAKSNLFVTQEVTQDITVNSDGSYKKKLTLTYKNPAPPSNCNLEAGQLCLNGVLRDWVRIYVPKGATLGETKGFELEVGTNEDLGHTVFDGFFTISPQSVKKIEIEYTVPTGVVADPFKMLIQSQPGTDPVEHTISLNGGKAKVMEVDSDTELTLNK